MEAPIIASNHTSNNHQKATHSIYIYYARLLRKLYDAAVEAFHLNCIVLSRPQFHVRLKAAPDYRLRSGAATKPDIETSKAALVAGPRTEIDNDHRFARLVGIAKVPDSHRVARQVVLTRASVVVMASVDRVKIDERARVGRAARRRIGQVEFGEAHDDKL